MHVIREVAKVKGITLDIPLDIREGGEEEGVVVVIVLGGL